VCGAGGEQQVIQWSVATETSNREAACGGITWMRSTFLMCLGRITGKAAILCMCLTPTCGGQSRPVRADRIGTAHVAPPPMSARSVRYWPGRKAKAFASLLGNSKGEATASAAFSVAAAVQFEVMKAGGGGPLSVPQNAT